MTQVTMVVIQNPENYKFVKFQKSNSKGKKYDAILKNKTTGRTKTVPFGALGYQHYKDSTGLGLYSSKNHLDKERRKNFRSRHGANAKRKYSSAYFAYKYLW
jgi:hypothetical protein